MRRKYLDKLYIQLHQVKRQIEDHAKINDFDGECTEGIHRAVKHQLQEQHFMIVGLIDDYLIDHSAKS